MRHHAKIITIAVLAIALAGVVIAFFYLPSINSKEVVPQSTPSPSYRVSIGGLAFFGTIGGQKSISIKADRFVVEKKKFGFLSFSLINVARLENAVIDVYGVRKKTFKQPSAVGHAPSGTSAGEALTFDHVLSNESFSMFPTKNISAIEAGPIVVQFRDDENIFTRLSASSGTVRLKEQDILFSGSVRVTSGSRELFTDQLMFLPQKGLLKVDGNYTMKTGDGSVRGRRLTADIHLKPLNR